MAQEPWAITIRANPRMKKKLPTSWMMIILFLVVLLVLGQLAGLFFEMSHFLKDFTISDY